MRNDTQLNSLRTLVRKYITDGIASGSFGPGDRINEQTLADMLGVSRTPAREALLQLNSEGLLDYLPRKGFSIRELGEKEKWETYELVAVLDAYCARTAVDRLEDSDFLQMHELVDMMDIAIKYRNLERYRSLQMQFHMVYRKKCENEMVLHILDNAEVGIVPQTFVSSDDDEEIVKIYSMLNDEHRRILELLESRDAYGVSEFLLQTHWSARLPEYTVIGNGVQKTER